MQEESDFTNDELDQGETIFEFVQRLRSYTLRTRYLGNLCLMLLVLSILFLISILNIRVFYGEDYFRGQQLLIASVTGTVLMALQLMQLLIFERTRSDADIIAQELADELHWNFNPSSNRYLEPRDGGSRSNVGLEIRVVIRTFSRQRYLPYLNTSNDIPVYLVLTLTCVMTGLVIIASY